MVLFVLQVYYEDNEYAIRLQLSGLRASIIKGAKVLHGEFEGNEKYYSGSLTAMDSDSKIKTQLRAKLDRGIQAAQTYVTQKWGTHNPPSRFKGPFDNANVPLSGWVMLPARRHWIQSGSRVADNDTTILSNFLQSFEHSHNSTNVDKINAVVEGETVCAFETETCECKGTVYFGIAMTRESDEDLFPTLSTSEQMKARKHFTKEVNGNIKCVNTEFEGDPLFGSAKYCRCFPN